jgi:hypothetical protein
VNKSLNRRDAEDAEVTQRRKGRRYLDKHPHNETGAKLAASGTAGYS